MVAILAIVGFAIAMYVLNRVLVRREHDGDFDPQSPSSAAQPGLRSFFDYGHDGFGEDGIRQRPPDR